MRWVAVQNNTIVQGPWAWPFTLQGLELPTEEPAEAFVVGDYRLAPVRETPLAALEGKIVLGATPALQPDGTVVNTWDIADAPIVVSPAPAYSKLAIRRAMRSLGSEPALDAILAASPQFAHDWADATEIDLSDPVLQTALAQAGIDTAPIVEELR